MTPSDKKDNHPEVLQGDMALYRLGIKVFPNYKY